MGEYLGGDVNTVLMTVKRLSDDGDAQLSILTHALVIACLSCGVEREVVLEKVAQLWDEDHALTNLPEHQ